MAQSVHESGSVIFGNRDGEILGGLAKVQNLSADVSPSIEDHNTVFIADAVDLTVNLPPTVEGLVYHFIVQTLSTTTGLSLSPNAADKIQGHGLTEADDKDLINTAATDALGDAVTLIGDGTDGWWITSIVGTWAREA